MSIALLLLACAPGPDPSPPPAESTPSSVHTSPTADTSTGAGTGHTGATEPSWEPPLKGILPPTTIVESPSFARARSWGESLLGAPVEGSADILVAGIPSEDETQPYGSYFLTGPFPRGTVPPDAVWDGVSGWGGSPYGATPAIHRVPDADGDGVEDYWLFSRLVPGPLMGRLHALARVEGDESIAYIEGSDLGPEGVQAADFDADGDGIGDILIDSAVGPDAIVSAGPHAGEGFAGQATQKAHVLQSHGPHEGDGV